MNNPSPDCSFPSLPQVSDGLHQLDTVFGCPTPGIQWWVGPDYVPGSRLLIKVAKRWTSKGMELVLLRSWPFGDDLADVGVEGGDLGGDCCSLDEAACSGGDVCAAS